MPRRLIWDNEAGIGRGKRYADGLAAFTGTLATTLQQLKPYDREPNGVVERRNGSFETSFMPGRHEGRLVAVHHRAWARGMTITDTGHLAAAKVLREQRQRSLPKPDDHEELVRDLADYDLAFGLIDADTITDGEVA